jgi:hypothetical protein
MNERILTEDENEFEDSEMDEGYRPIDLNRFDREEKPIYESIEAELDLDAVLRELPEFDPTEDLDTVDLNESFDDALGG